MNNTQRRMLVEMQRYTELIERASARMDAILSDPEPAEEAVVAAAEELARLTKEIQPGRHPLRLPCGQSSPGYA
jgi:hypothetical protein